MTEPDPHPVSLLDYERIAAARLPRMTYDYFAAGADDGVTLRSNREAFDRITLRPRVLRGVGTPDLSAGILGRTHSVPILVAPTAFAKLAHPDGELAIARACETSGVTHVLSTLSTFSMEAVAEASSAPRWFQVYVFKDREVTRALVERAATAGCEALVLTVDVPVLGSREADVRNRFALPEGIYPENLISEEERRVWAEGGSGLARYFAAHIDAALTWDDVDWLRSISQLPVLVKGILRGDDAVLALAHGAAGVIVSNHGGRQLDGVPAAIDALQEVAEAVHGRADVLMDGGVRRGTDIVKALALGATAVLIGRPVLWGLTVDGEAGARRVLDVLSDELRRALALCGCRSLADVRPDLVGAPLA
jgi:4-hydroxymandelate oxidase